MTTPIRSARPFLVCAALLATTISGRTQGPLETQAPVQAAQPGSPAATPRPESKWDGIIDPGRIVQPLSVRDKLVYVVHEENPLVSLGRIAYSGGYGILANSDPKYGTDKAGFGERVGAAALRLAITRELSDSFLPILLHEDPRYYRQGTGTYLSRTGHAFRRVVFTQSDSGARTINYSDLLGRGMNAALTETYYPEVSVTTGVVLRTWGVSVAVLGGTKVFDEFWPDIRGKLKHKSD